ncbi:MAG: peptide-methionine (S)-S-oxide reductase MsrA [Pyrinomonadaceae bacterium]
MFISTKLAVIFSVIVAVGCGVVSSSTKTPAIAGSQPEIGEAPFTQSAKGQQTAVFAGGCFWGVEAVFEHVNGVTDVKSGYTGGDAKTANYERVSDGDTGHAEVVEIKFDPAKVTYEQLLEVFFSVVHDPTQLNYQGPDHGTQYRSAIFYTDETQKNEATAYIKKLEDAKTFPKKIVTQVVPLEQFFVAEGYHQDYMKKNPNDSYIVYHDKPKVEALKAKFSGLFAEK